MATTHKETEIDRFQARSDKGRIYTVIKYQTMITFKPVSGPSSKAKGGYDYALQNGDPVSEIDSSTFKVLLTDEIIRKV